MQFSDRGSSITSLQEAESILQTLADGERDAEAFATLESDLDNGESIEFRCKSSHDTPNDPVEEKSEDSLTPDTDTTRGGPGH